MKLSIPEFSLVVLVGISGSGKSTFAKKHFKATEVVSSDACRGLVSDDENRLEATKDAFNLLHYLTGIRLSRRLLTVIDATNVQEPSRKTLLESARRYHCLPIAVVFNLPERVCEERNRQRPDRNLKPHVLPQQHAQMRKSLRRLKDEGFRQVHVLNSVEDVESAVFERTRLWNDKTEVTGPFDLVGDVHGCFSELVSLLTKLGYQVDEGNFNAISPNGRKAVFLGDLVDRGPQVPSVLKLVMNMVTAGTAYCVPGNHDIKLVRKLAGKDVQVKHGLAETLAQIGLETPEFRKQAGEFLHKLISHLVFDGGNLVAAHAGMKEEMQGRGSSAVRDFALFGETTGETDEFGLPIRANWAAEYRGKAMVVYGHTPVPEPEWLNNTINIDTGCVFGGKLTALRYPEREIVSVDALKVYCEPVRPLRPEPTASDKLSSQQKLDDLLDLQDVLGKLIIQTRLVPSVTIREENGLAALEVMSRFAANPKWLIYLPPTMSPAETSELEGWLEHPAETFRYFRRDGVVKVVCEQKHMGSRCVVVLCRDEQTATKRFGVMGEGIGICYTRTGRRFFEDNSPHEKELLDRLNKSVGAAGLWDELKSDWLCLDCELMPWSAKAQALLRQQYAPVGAAAKADLVATCEALRTAARRYPDLVSSRDRYEARLPLIEKYIEAYRHYCWAVNSVEDYKLAPFHLLAAEDAVFVDRDHVWHMDTLARICKQDPALFLATPYRVLDLGDESQVAGATSWWEELTASGGEGMVVKPFDFTVRGKRGMVQPAVKCRGREYLRIIYGPEYSAPENLERLRSRSLGAKRSLAVREYALGIESLERFVHRESLRRVHECVFGVLALESEPVDPRL